MRLDLKRMTIKNFLSYGNDGTVIDFEKGLSIIQAANGAGKSSIIDALTFVLFGKPFRNIKLNSLVNYINRKNCLVTLDFNIGGDQYRIERGICPDVFDVYRNGTTLDKLSTKALHQSNLEDKILKIDYNIFKRVMCLAVNSVPSFLEAPLGKRREIFEGAFGLSNITELREALKVRSLMHKNEQTLNNSNLMHSENRVKSLKNLRDSLISKSEDFKRETERNLRSLNQEIKDNQLQIDYLNEKINDCLKKRDELDTYFQENDSSAVRNNLSLLRERIYSSKSELLKCEDILKNAEGDRCPICNSELGSDRVVSWFNDVREKVDSLKLLEIDQKKEESELNSLIKKIEDRKELYSKIDNYIETNREKIKILNEQIQKLENRAKELKPSSKLDLWSEDKELELLSSCKILEEFKDKSVTIDKSVSLDADLNIILSDKGIKSYFYSKVITPLNEICNRYLKKFNLDTTVVFENDLNIQLYKGCVPLEYHSLSNGEKTRLNVSIQLSINNLSKKLLDWDCSVFFIDEVLDQGIDTDGIISILSSIENITKVDNRIGVYVISHKVDLNELPGKIIDDENFHLIHIEKEGLFSRLEKNR